MNGDPLGYVETVTTSKKGAERRGVIPTSYIRRTAGFTLFSFPRAHTHTHSRGDFFAAGPTFRRDRAANQRDREQKN